MLALLTALILSGSPSAAETACRQALERGVRKVEKLPMAKRVGAGLEALSRCQALGELAVVAAKAKKASRVERSRLLAPAALAKLPSECRPEAKESSADRLAQRCPPGKDKELATELLADLDPGTYLFVLAVREQLSSLGVLDAKAERVLDNLVLSAALQGETAKGPATGAP